MQGFERTDGQLADAGALAGHLVPADSMFAFLAAHRAEVFRDADYADLFAPPGLGRASIPATRMAAVLTLQVLHDYSDRETVEAVRFDVPACRVAGRDRGEGVVPVAVELVALEVPGFEGLHVLVRDPDSLGV